MFQTWQRSARLFARLSSLPPKVLGQNRPNQNLLHHLQLAFLLILHQTPVPYKLLEDSDSCAMLHPQLLQHQVRGDLVHLHENGQHPPEEAGVGDSSGGHLDQIIVRAGNTFLQTAGHTAVIGGDVVCRDYAVAGPVLQVGAVGPLQHQGVWVGVGAEAGDWGVLHGLRTVRSAGRLWKEPGWAVTGESVDQDGILRRKEGGRGGLASWWEN
jgi:hypothetical protein